MDRETSTMAAPRNLSDLRPIPAPTPPSPQLTWSLLAGLLDETSHCPQPPADTASWLGAAAPHPRQGPLSSCALTQGCSASPRKGSHGEPEVPQSHPPNTSTAKHWVEKHGLCMRRDLSSVAAAQRGGRGGGGRASHVDSGPNSKIF